MTCCTLTVVNRTRYIVALMGGHGSARLAQYVQYIRLFVGMYYGGWVRQIDCVSSSVCSNMVTCAQSAAISQEIMMGRIYGGSVCQSTRMVVFLQTGAYVLFTLRRPHFGCGALVPETVSWL
jgi:hypothetical protein